MLATSDVPSPRPTLLVIDDTPENLSLMHGLLKDAYTVKGATSGEKGLQLAWSVPPPDLILLDVMMPGIDGYEVCRRLKRDPRSQHIPVIFLTARADVEDERCGFELGAVDYIIKPFSPPIVLSRVRAQLALKTSADFLRDNNAYLSHEVAQRTAEIAAIQDVTILAMASMAETRDSETGNHIRRTQHYVRALALQLQANTRFQAFLTPRHIDLLFRSAPLHDIGKVGIPDRILLKPGALTPEEFDIMKTHTTLGRDAIVHAEQALGTEVSFLRFAKEIAYSHQEKWDGSGYPQGLRGDQIPVSARLMAVADVYDALISRRVYKAPMSHEAALDVMRQGRGTHFDPDVLDAFLAIEHEVRAIASEFADTDEALTQRDDYLRKAQPGSLLGAP